MGFVVAALASNVPFLIVLSQYKVWMFTASFMIIVLSAWLLYRSGRTCPADPELAKQCQAADKWNKRFLWGVVVVWSIGFFTAYVLPLI